ncbi:MAG: phosphoribosyltransferase [Phycisphaeraceae bacterium]
MKLPYANRTEAGRVLADALGDLRSAPDTLVLALPRGGVPVAWEVAHHLELPLDLMIVRKLGVPGQPELAMGAIASGGARVLNEEVIRRLGIADQAIETVAEHEQRELQRRAEAYRGDRPEPDVAGRAVVLVDDGLATGSTMAAAVAALEQREAGRITVAVPVGSREAGAMLEARVDRFVCPALPENFFGVGQWYQNFQQTSDDEVRDLLARAWQAHPPAGPRES